MEQVFTKEAVKIALKFSCPWNMQVLLSNKYAEEQLKLLSRRT